MRVKGIRKNYQNLWDGASCSLGY
uniref:Truncated envelope glycoprotein n=1 Tax=Human immunodeficiency virus type 1 TaxID=11676 RepID=B1PDL7_HV1|nr:truncated envelope glycoprotein [Human immunodeficiency virus 1]